MRAGVLGVSLGQCLRRCGRAAVTSNGRIAVKADRSRDRVRAMQLICAAGDAQRLLRGGSERAAVRRGFEPLALDPVRKRLRNKGTLVLEELRVGGLGDAARAAVEELHLVELPDRTRRAAPLYRGAQQSLQ
jgi:hypothetical protein